MGSFEWMELHTLTADITNSRSRLAEARANKDRRLARELESEIMAAEKRRARLLAHITHHLSEAPAEAAAAAGADAAPAFAAETRNAEAEQPLDLAEGIGGSDATVPADAAPAGSASGGVIVWDQLTADDIERARNEVAGRRAEMLARHAEELKALDADRQQLEALEQAIAAFLRKYTPAAAGVIVDLAETRAAAE